jgi:DNA-binding NarL/FixJ family response regulator
LQSADKHAQKPKSGALPFELKCCLMLVAAGLTNAALAETLHVSLATANINVNHILGKFHISDKTQTALSAGHHNLVS